MTTLLPSRNPFADPTLPTFADLRERLKQDRELPKAKRQNWMWALKTVMRASAADPAEVLAHPTFVRNLMQRAAPESLGLTRLAMTAHRFRHAVGKIFLDRNPGQYEVVRQLLGHKDIQTTIAFYCGAETASAVRHYARTILGIRHQEHRVRSP